MWGVRIRKRGLIFLIVIVLTSVLVSAHHKETSGHNIFADTPYRIQGDHTAVPILVEVKDAGSGGIIEQSFATAYGAVTGYVGGTTLGTLGGEAIPLEIPGLEGLGTELASFLGQVVGGALGAISGLDGDYCDFDLRDIKIWWDRDGDSGECCNHDSGGDIDCEEDHDDCTKYNDDVPISFKSYRYNGNNLVLTDNHYNMYEDGDWYDMIYILKEGTDLNGNPYTLSGDVQLFVQFNEDDWWDDCFDDDVFSIISLTINNESLPEIRGEKYYGGDTHYHSSYTDIHYLIGVLADIIGFNVNEFGNPILPTTRAGIGVGLDWTTVTDHSQKLSEKMWDSLGSETTQYSDNNFKILRGEEVSCGGFFGYKHYLSYNLTDVIGGTEIFGSPYGCDEVVNKVIDQGAFGYVAHPGMNDMIRDEWDSEDLDLDYRGYELWNIHRDGPYFKWIDTWVNELLDGKKRFILAGGDAHGEFSPAYMTDRYRVAGEATYGMLTSWCHMCGLEEENVWSALRDGNCYLRRTDGPALHFDINGKKMGEELKISKSKKADIEISWNKSHYPTKAFYLNLSIGDITAKKESVYKSYYINAANLSDTIVEAVNLTTSCSGTRCYFRVVMYPANLSEFYDEIIAYVFSNPIWVEQDPRNCQEPHTGMKIREDTTLCPGVYNLYPCFEGEGSALKGAITIKSDDVTLDCNGATIIGEGKAVGVLNPGYDRVTIKNCSIQNYEIGIDVKNEPDEHNGIYYQDNAIYYNNLAGSNIGIHLRNNSPPENHVNELSNNVIKNSKDSGIFLEESSYNRLIYNHIEENGFGIGMVANSVNNEIKNNDISKNKAHGIYIHACPNCILTAYITENRIDSNYHMGILIVDNIQDNFIAHNNITKNRFGIVFASGSYNLIEDNNIFGNKQHGIEILNGMSNAVIANAVWNNSNGIYLHGQSSDNNVLGNDLRHNSQYSLTLMDPLLNNNCDNNIDESNYADADCKTEECKEPGQAGTYAIPILYLFNKTGITIEDEVYSEILLCSVNHSIIDNVTIARYDKMKNDGIFLVDSYNNTINNSKSSKNRDGIKLYNSHDNFIQYNVFDRNKFYGIEIMDSHLNEISSNEVCFNGWSDFMAGGFEFTQANFGYENMCLKPDGWEDRICYERDILTGDCVNWTVTKNCTSQCPIFTLNNPSPTNYINGSTKMSCNETFSINDDATPGVLIINADDIVLDCCNSSLIGDGNGIGIYNPGFEDVVIRDCKIFNYSQGVSIDSGSDSNMLYNNFVVNNNDGINLTSSDDLEIYLNYVCENSKYDFNAVNVSGIGVNTCDNSSGWSDVYRTNNCSMRCTPLPLPPLTECNCSYCDECEKMLDSASCDIVYLTKDIYLHQGTCIDNPSGFQNKVFDCQKHLIQGDGVEQDYGIRMQGNVGKDVIKNCVISNFDTGIFMKSLDSYVHDNRIENNFIVANKNGIVFETVHDPFTFPWVPWLRNNTIKNNIISQNNDYGIRFFSLEGSGLYGNNYILNNRISSSQYGILINKIPFINVSHNTIFLNNETGIYIAASGTEPEFVFNNTIARNRMGIRMGVLYQNEINKNNVCRNTLQDFDILGGPMAGNGTGNYCDVYDGWNDTGTTGCTYLCEVNIECHCSNCIECSHKLQDPMCDIIYLDNDIHNHTGTCINSFNNPECYYFYGEEKDYSFCINYPLGFEYKDFDCQEHIIDGSLSNNQSGYGLVMYASDINEIRNCNIRDFERGIYMVNSDNNYIYDNEVHLNLYGVYVHSSQNNTISNNNLTLNYMQSVFVREECGNTITNNIGGLYGKPIRYEHDAAFLTIANDEYSEILFCNVHESLIENVTLNNGNLTCDGIFLLGSNGNTIKNVNSIGNYRGINLRQSHNNIISGSTINENLHGVYIEMSNWTHVINNTIHSSYGDGIDIWESFENEVNNNDLDSNMWGVYVEVASNNNIINNNITSGVFGVNIEGASQNTILNNRINNNNYSGVFMYSNCHYNVIAANQINDNRYGIISVVNFDHMGGSMPFLVNTNNTIIENDISGNEKTGIFSFYTNLIINSNNICGNGVDFNSTNWINSSGIDNACNTPNGWNDTGTTGCNRTCPMPPCTDIDADGICDCDHDSDYLNCAPKECVPDPLSVWWVTCGAMGTSEEECSKIGYCFWNEEFCAFNFTNIECGPYSGNEELCESKPYCKCNNEVCEICVDDRDAACSVYNIDNCGTLSDACRWATDCIYVGDEELQICYERNLEECTLFNYCKIREGCEPGFEFAFITCSEQVNAEDCEVLLHCNWVGICEPDFEVVEQCGIFQNQNKTICLSKEYCVWRDENCTMCTAGPDNCPEVPNPGQEDSNSNGIGDVCEYVMFELFLHEGWNLISIPLILEDNSVANVFADVNYTSLFYYNQSWRNLTEINPVLGMWIKCGSESYLLLQGSEPENTIIWLNNGLNLIGYPSLAEKNIPIVFNQINNSLKNVLSYENNNWYSYSPIKPNNNLIKIKPGLGYWVNVNDTVTLKIS